VANIVRECSGGLAETGLKIKKGLRRSPVLHADQTGLRVNKRLAYVHVESSPRLTHMERSDSPPGGWRSWLRATTGWWLRGKRRSRPKYPS